MKNIIFNNQDYNLSYVKEKHEREEKKKLFKIKKGL